MTQRASVSVDLAADADAVFASITDLARLPKWNDRMTRVIELPDRLEPGAEWVVEFKVFERKWRSRSRVHSVDLGTRSFAYRTQTDDGNPSVSEWRWDVEPTAAGSRVTVAWNLHPATFWRRLLFARIRARQLARTEVPASLAALGRVAQTRTAGTTSVSDDRH